MVNIQSAPLFCMTDGFSKEAANIALFPFAETKEALAYIETGRAKGKAVVKVV